MIPLSVGDSIRVFFFLATDEGSILLLDLQSQIGRALFMYKNSGVYIYTFTVYGYKGTDAASLASGVELHSCPYIISRSAGRFPLAI